MAKVPAVITLVCALTAKDKRYVDLQNLVVEKKMRICYKGLSQLRTHLGQLCIDNVVEKKLKHTQRPSCPCCPELYIKSSQSVSITLHTEFASAPM